MRASIGSLAIAFVALTSSIPAQTAGSAQTVAGTPRKSIRAVRLVDAAPRIDGRIDDDAWQRASFTTDFVQKDPVQGATPVDGTELALAYDDHALYVAARMHRADVASLRGQVTRRDDFGRSEVIVVSLDTYYDRRTASSFAVTTGGGRVDYYHADDNEYSRDFTFDPVWSADATIDSSGWSAEMRIPFSQLRFNARDEMVWGMNVNRWIPDRDEDIYWVMVPKNETGWASRFGEIVGLDGIRPPGRLEVLPYVAAQGTVPDEVDRGNPFDTRFRGRTGADVKLGIGPNLTLDATVNPDFGQVEADPARVNLSDFESIFSERRPFFVEGAQLLRGNGPTYFYSRRIGAAPHIGAGADHVDVAGSTTILAASKITGRLSTGTSVGAMLAVTEREHARTFSIDDGTFGTTEVEPLTGYGAVRVQQEFGESRSTIGIIATAVHRDLRDDALRDVLARDAFAGGVDYSIRIDGGAWDVTGHVGASHVAGDSLAIVRLQRSSARYYQRPDAGYVDVDSSRRYLSGFAVSSTVSKNAGNWGGYLGFGARSPGFELNDLGQLATADDVDLWGGIRFRDDEPGSVIRRWSFEIDASAGSNFGDVQTYRSLQASAHAVATNYWYADAWGGVNPAGISNDLSRGGPDMGTPLDWFYGLGVGTPTNRSAFAWLQASTSRNAIGGWDFSFDPGVSATIGDRWTLSFHPHYSVGSNPRQYVATLDGGPAATYGRRYVFARLDESYLSAQLRVGFVLTPSISIDLYAEPFAGAVRFHDFGELPEPGSTGIRRYASGPGGYRRIDESTIAVDDGPARFDVHATDFTFLSFRSNVVIRWEWLAGSTAYVVWQRDAGAFVPTYERVGPGHLGDAIGAPGGQIVALKVAYWIPVD